MASFLEHTFPLQLTIIITSLKIVAYPQTNSSYLNNTWIGIHFCETTDYTNNCEVYLSFGNY